MALSLNGSTGISGIDGHSGVPAIKGADADTGIFFGTDTASISTAGANRFHITSTGLIGVGTSSPAGGFHVDAASGVDGPVFDSGGTANTNHALLVRDSSNNQLLRVNNNGDIGIGVSNPQSKLDVRGGISVSTASNVDTVIQRNFAPAGSYSFILSGGAGLTSEAYPTAAPTDASAGPTIKLIGGNPANDLYGGGIQYHANGNLSPVATGPGNAHVFYTRAGVDTYSERFRIRHDGGVTFNGDTATANALDDYEEGTWTPVVSGANISIGQSRYTKIGRLVNVQVDMTVSRVSTSGLVYIQGLPFSVPNQAWANGSMYLQYISLGGVACQINPYAISNSSNINFKLTFHNNTVSRDIDFADMPTASFLNVNVNYCVN